MTRSPFEVLEIPDPDHAIWADVYAAYRRRSKETHPDLGGSAEAFREVNEAFETLLRWNEEATVEPQPGPAASYAAQDQVDESPLPANQPLVTPRVRGAWRRRRPSDPPAYQPRRGAAEGPRRAAP